MCLIYVLYYSLWSHLTFTLEVKMWCWPFTICPLNDTILSRHFLSKLGPGHPNSFPFLS